MNCNKGHHRNFTKKKKKKKKQEQKTNMTVKQGTLKGSQLWKSMALKCRIF